MQKQIKNSLTIKVLVLALGAFGSGVLHADWSSQSLNDRVDWLVNHEETLAKGELSQELATLSEKDKEDFITQLCGAINNVAKEKGYKGPWCSLVQKIYSLPVEDVQKCIKKLNKMALEMVLVCQFECGLAKGPMDVEMWWKLSEEGKSICFKHLSEDGKDQVQGEICFGSTDLKIRYFKYLDQQAQKRIWEEDLLTPSAKALCFKYFSVDEQRRIWEGELKNNPRLRAILAGELEQSLLQAYRNELDEYTQKRLKMAGMLPKD